MGSWTKLAQYIADGGATCHMTPDADGLITTESVAGHWALRAGEKSPSQATVTLP